jgi:hypothetical protein
MVLEASVIKYTPASSWDRCASLDVLCTASGCIRIGYVFPATRFWGGPEQSGVKPSTYSTKGFSY